MPGPIIAIPRRMNYGRPQITRLGPWPRGVIGREDPEQLQPGSLVYANNVDVLPTGELRQRPPIRRADIGNVGGTDATLAALGAPNFRIDATYTIKDATAATGVTGGNSLMLIAHTLQWVVFTNLTNRIAGGNALVYKTNITSSDVVIYNNKAWGIVQTGSTVGTPGQVWSIDLNNVTAGPTFYNTGPTASGTAYPRQLAIIKDRMYAWNYVITNTGSPDFSTNVNNIWFSKTGNPAVFTGDTDAGFFGLSNSSNVPSNVNLPVAIASVRNSVYIFTRTSTWLLSLPSSGIPTNGTLSLLSEHIGATEPQCVTTYDNKVFVAGVAGIYEIINGNFTDIGYALGPRVRNLFSYENLSTVGLSVAEERLWVLTTPDFSQTDLTGLYDPPIDTALIFNLKSRAWSSYHLGPPAFYFGSPPPNWEGQVPAFYKVIPFNSWQISSGCSVSTLQSGTTVQNTINDGALLCDINSGNLWVFKDGEPTADAFATGVAEYLRLPWADIWDTFVSGTATIQQPIPMTIWTQDMEGGTVETASWKRYYSVVVNLFSPKYVKNGLTGTLALTLTDHNNNTISDASINIPIVQGQSYYAVKAYTSLRARHIQYRLVITPSTTGPFSLMNLDVLAKVKQPEESAQVGG